MSSDFRLELNEDALKALAAHMASETPIEIECPACGETFVLEGEKTECPYCHTVVVRQVPPAEDLEL